MPGGRRIPITVDADTKGDFDKAARGLEDVAKSGDDADKSLGKLSKGHQALDAEINKTAISVKGLRAEFEKTGDVGLLKDASKLERTRQGLERLKTQFTEVGKSEADVARVDASIVHLGTDIDKTKAALKGMGEEFQRSGKVNVDELKTLSNTLRELERAKAAVEKLKPGDSGKKDSGGLLNFALDEAIVSGLKSARGAVTGAWDSLWKSIESNPIVSTVVIGSLLAGLPIVVATVSGAIASAVNLGVGGGVLALGISRAVADARVAAAWSRFGDTAAAEMDRASVGFVDPLIRSAGVFETAFVSDVMPHVGSAMDALAPQIDGLTQGVVGFLHELGPGFDDAISAARPFLDLLSQHLPEIGASISSFLGHLNNAGPGAEQFFHDILTLTEGTIRSLGWLVEKGAAVYEEFTALGLLLSGDFKGAMEVAKLGFHDLVSSGGQGEKSFGGFHNKTIDVNTALGLYNGTVSKTAAQNGQLLKSVDDVATVYDGLAKKIGLVHATSDTLEGQMTDKLMGTLLGMGHATLGVAESLTSLKDTFSQTGVAVDWNTGLIAMNTQAGQRQREGVLSAVEANLRMYDAQIASGTSADVAAAKYGQNTEALRAQLSQAGLTEAQIHDLIGEYGNVPKNVSTAIATQGLTTAIEGLNTLLRQLLGLDGKTIFTYTHHVQIIDTVQGQTAIVGGGQIPAQAKGGIRRAAVGMIIPPSNPGTVLTGEPQTGGEVLIPMRGIDTGRAAMLGRTALGGYGLDVVPRQDPGYASPVMPARGGTGGNTYQISISVAPGASPAEVGAATVEAIRAYERLNGKSWRN